MPETARRVLQSTMHVDASQLEWIAAARCTAGVAIALLAGAVVSPETGAFAAVGAVSVGFGSFQGAYRSRAAVMIYAAVGMGVAIFAGTVTGAHPIASVFVASIAAFAAGLLSALGPGAAFVGLQVGVSVLIAGGFPAGAFDAAVRGASVLAGGLAQTLLVVAVWPWQRFPHERRSVGSVFRSLASYAATLATRQPTAPEPHTLAGLLLPAKDPQPFARAAEVLVFQGLLDEAERIRASLAALAIRHREFLDAHHGCAARLATAAGDVLSGVADAIAHGDEAVDRHGAWVALDACARELPENALVDALLGQLRAAWRMTSLLATEREAAPAPARVRRLTRRAPLADGLTTIGANLTLRSAAFRHALRLAVVVGIAAAIHRGGALTRGYWMPMTALLVLKPEFHDTLARGVARIGGTLAGAAIATAIVAIWAPGPLAVTVLLLAFVWACYAIFRSNYALFAVCLTAYVIFILMLSGVGEMTAATLRAEYTVAGGVLALAAYLAWPTWAGSTAREALAAMLDAKNV